MELTRINNDVNGNPRYVVHFLDLLSKEEQNPELGTKSMNTAQVIRYLYNQSETEYLYEKALKRAKSIGGRKFHNKQYGGGIAFQSYNTTELIKQIEEIQNTNF
jgi:hypothetical protein